MSGELDEGPLVQEVVAVNGVAYGVIGADLHVFAGSGAPLYLLANWPLSRTPPPPTPALTDPGDGLERLRDWRDAVQPLALRWLYGPVEQGAMLAERLAEESSGCGWKVTAAFPGPGDGPQRLPRQDLHIRGAVGRLVVIDRADRWPLAHMTWLLSNSMFHEPATRVRVLLIAGSLDGWPVVRATVANLAAATSSQTADLVSGRTG